jgi:hypothetical protein
MRARSPPIRSPGYVRLPFLTGAVLDPAHVAGFFSYMDRWCRPSVPPGRPVSMQMLSPVCSLQPVSLVMGPTWQLVYLPLP